MKWRYSVQNTLDIPVYFFWQDWNIFQSLKLSIVFVKAEWNNSIEETMLLLFLGY